MAQIYLNDNPTSIVLGVDGVYIAEIEGESFGSVNVEDTYRTNTNLHLMLTEKEARKLYFRLKKYFKLEKL